MGDSERNNKSSDASRTHDKGTTTDTYDINSRSTIAQSKLSANVNVKSDRGPFTLKNARTVDHVTLTDNKLTSTIQIPTYIIQTLMIANYHALEFKVTDKDINESVDNYDSDKSEDEDDAGINPLDGLLSVFHCSDIHFRRVLVTKLSACQLSVPFLLPDPAAPSTNVTMLLSALQSITKSWKAAPNKGESAKEVFATEYPFPVVSFIRIGKDNMSKSWLINKIMSDTSNYHDFFFHKNIQGGENRRKVVDGLVELSWFLPGGGENQTLQSEICFANLRGDAGEFKKQLDVLLKISSVLCILLPSEYPNATTTKILKQTIESEAKVILIFNEKNQEDTKKYFLDLRSERNGKLSLVTKANKRNEYSFVQSIGKNIQNNVHEVKATALVELASSAHKYGIQLDDYKLPAELEEILTTWLKRGIKEAKIFLKLQVHVPKFADLEREKYCPTRQGTSFKRDGNKRNANEIHKDIEAEKKHQKNSRKELDEKVLHYLTSVAKMTKSERILAMSDLKYRLDKMSLKIMGELHQEYRAAYLELKKKKEPRRTSTTRSPEEKCLIKLEKLISECSFGLEHIIREFAELSQLSDITTIDYADVAADMLLSGQPLELLNGDSSYIPLQWFHDVYSKLGQKTNDAKIFVISVLGIQSSGKSTMLNTMFGLEFPVSAGRCTRGAFASLIDVGKSLHLSSQFDYLLIIDTEGLRGSGDPHLRQHDNEMATFSIGVADVTIVNIFGENHNEIEEFLEIAVHAFLKMKLVHKTKVCKIVHQNVGATDAREKLLVARLKLKEKLDKMTKIAALQENCQDKFQTFDDIILFDENEDVFYLPSLLKGSPPMAPVNPEYGRGVQRIKENIILLMCSKKCFLLSVSHFRDNVCTLWKAILKENFIFCFRNTIEVKAFTSLDRKYFQVFVTLMVMGMKRLENEIQVGLTRCTTRDERKQKWEKSEREILERAEELKEEMRREMETFVQTNEDKAVLEQWREYIINRIKQQKDTQVHALMNTCLATFRYLQTQQDVEENKQAYKEQLLQKAKAFMTSAIDTKDPNKCKQAFDQEWKQWISKVPCCLESKIDINNEMENVLVNTNSILNMEMSEKLKQRNSIILNFQEDTPDIDINELRIKTFSEKKGYIKRAQQQAIIQAKLICDEVVEEGVDFVKNTSLSGLRPTRNDLTQLYHKVIDGIDQKTKSRTITFSKSLKCDILLHTFANAYDVFDKMEESYIQKRNIKDELETNLRPELELHFFNLCSEVENDKLAATLIVGVLKNPIKSMLNKTMGATVVHELLKNTMYQSKGAFRASVLIQLGEEGKFESYIPYFENPVKFLKNTLMQSIEDYCLKQEPSFINVILTQEAKKIKEKLFTAISTASELTKTRGEKLNFWIQQFVENCSVLNLREDTFAVAAIIEDLKNLDVFQKKLWLNVEEFVNSLIELGVDQTRFREWNPSPHELLFESMFGCQSCCPLCYSLCDHAVEHHAGSHSTTIHRPQCLVGYRNIQTKILVPRICTNSVATNRTFQNLDTLEKEYSYQKYRSVNSYYASWSIPPDPTFDGSTYWQWFVATFTKELAKYYEAEQADFPSAWNKHTFNNVRNQLRREYMLK